MEGVVLERSSVLGARSDASLVEELLREVRELRREAAELRQEVAELRAENLELRQQVGYWGLSTRATLCLKRPHCLLQVSLWMGFMVLSDSRHRPPCSRNSTMAGPGRPPETPTSRWKTPSAEGRGSAR